MIPSNFEAIFSIFPYYFMAPKMTFFTGFGPRRVAGLAEQPKFLFAIVIWHLNENFVFFHSFLRSVQLHHDFILVPHSTKKNNNYIKIDVYETAI